jgi:Mrp family chromosome partitioning ATPase
MKKTEQAPPQFGDTAVRLGYLSAGQVQEALQDQARRREAGVASPIGSLLRERGLLTPEQITAVLRQLAGGDMPLSEDGIRLAARLKVLHAAAGNVIGVTGTLAEDVSRTTVELAVALAVMGQGQVLVVDANLRAPSLHELLGTQLAPGLAEHIAAQGERPLPLLTRVPALGAVPAGQPTPDLVASCMSPAAADVIDGYRRNYRYVLLNLGHITTQPEAAVTASRCDGVLIVLHAGVSQRSELSDMERMLEGLKVTHSGIVIARPATRRERKAA